MFIVYNAQIQDNITQSSTFNATIKVWETTDKPLNIPAKFLITIPAINVPAISKINDNESTINMVYVTLGAIILILLVVVDVLVLKLKFKKKADSDNI